MILGSQFMYYSLQPQITKIIYCRTPWCSLPWYCTALCLLLKGTTSFFLKRVSEHLELNCATEGRTSKPTAQPSCFVFSTNSCDQTEAGKGKNSLVPFYALRSGAVILLVYTGNLTKMATVLIKGLLSLNECKPWGILVLCTVSYCKIYLNEPFHSTF